ncbi:hypothetical protein CR513_47351, partial [Mucuna pruriens]
MAELNIRSGSIKRVVGGILKFKVVLGKLQKSLLVRTHKPSWSYCKDYCEERDDTRSVPEDVKEGHFAVIAEHGEGPKRFVVPLSCLNNPTFLRLLEQAAEEYGLNQHGALIIPCRPCQLETLLAHQWKQRQIFSNAILKTY